MPLDLNTHSLHLKEMVASLLRVIYGGVQDSRLLCQKGQPNPAFFVKAFIRAGRFTTQWTRLDFDTLPTLGNTSVITLPRKGHLISRLYLVTTMPDIAAPQTAAKAWCTDNGKTFAGPTFGWTNSLGHALIQNATIDIGGTRVERIDGRLLEIMDEFYTPLEKVSLMDKLLPRNSSSFTPGEFGSVGAPVQATTPLPFWFSCGDAGTFLPIDALQADPVKLSITFNTPTTLYVSTAQQDTTKLKAPPAGGEAYFPIGNSPFYYNDAAGTDISGLQGNPTQSTRVSIVPRITMPTTQLLQVLGDTYIMAEYIYLDAPEANRFRLADIQVPVLQHYAFDPMNTNSTAQANCYLKIGNPTRNLFFYLQRYEAPLYNAPFLATRDLSGAGANIAPWWPNASQINTRVHKDLIPGFVFRNSEPIRAVDLIYEGKLFRYSTTSPSVFRSLIPAMEQRKSPWVNRYMYNMPFAYQSGFLPPSQPCGEANLDKVVNINLRIDLNPLAGYTDPNSVPQFMIYIWAETYNIFRVYGGRGGMMFAY
jgi:Major capsid protein N-terminus